MTLLLFITVISQNVMAQQLGPAKPLPPLDRAQVALKAEYERQLSTARARTGFSIVYKHHAQPVHCRLSPAGRERMNFRCDVNWPYKGKWTGTVSIADFATHLVRDELVVAVSADPRR